MPLKVTDLTIDPNSLGDVFLLADVTPTYLYVNGERTKEIDGYRYHVVLPKHKMEKIGVKVSHKTPIINLEEEIPIGTTMSFSGLTVGTYFSNGQINLTCKADDVSIKGEEKGIAQNPHSVQNPQKEIQKEAKQ